LSVACGKKLACILLGCVIELGQRRHTAGAGWIVFLNGPSEDRLTLIFFEICIIFTILPGRAISRISLYYKKFHHFGFQNQYDRAVPQYLSIGKLVVRITKIFTLRCWCNPTSRFGIRNERYFGSHFIHCITVENYWTHNSRWTGWIDNWNPPNCRFYITLNYTKCNIKQNLYCPTGLLLIHVNHRDLQKFLNAKD
jgi:hypothetical protein